MINFPLSPIHDEIFKILKRHARTFSRTVYFHVLRWPLFTLAWIMENVYKECDQFSSWNHEFGIVEAIPRFLKATAPNEFGTVSSE